MIIRMSRIVIATALCSIWLLAPTLSHATLGEKADSIGRDRKALSAAKRSTMSQSRYTVHEMGSEANVVREYVSPAGFVFGVAWRGLVPPDLCVLLGSYDRDYRQAKLLKARKHGQRRMRVQGERVVVETWGHMKDLQGRAYDPALIPEGVSADEIR